MSAPEKQNEAVFSKILSATTENKMNCPEIKYESSRSDGAVGTQSEESERKKEAWKQELVGMGEDFLQMKSSQENLENRTDTAYIAKKNEQPILIATFNMKHFKREEIDIHMEDRQLIVEAKHTDDLDDRSYAKTMIRKLDLPENADDKMMNVDLTEDGQLIIEMPFNLPPEKKPEGPGVVPIYDAKGGKKKIRICLMIGAEFTEDDINIDIDGRILRVTAGYNEELGRYGYQTTQRDIKKEYRLPEYLEVDEVITKLKEGVLLVEVILKPIQAFKCKIAAEDVSVD